MSAVLIRGGRVVSSKGTLRADVLAVDGRIAAVGQDLGAELPVGGEVVDAAGLLVLPGVVDEHVHPIYRDDPRGTSIVAAHGGVTSMLHFAYAKPGDGLLDSVLALRDDALRGVLDFGIHAGMFDPARQAAEMAAVAAAGVRSFKVFLAYGAQGWMTDDLRLIDVLRRSKEVGGLVLVHCEHGVAIDVLEEDARAGRLGDDPVAALLATRPDVLEAEATSRTLALAEVFGADVLIVHVTCRRALEVVRAARARGQRVVAETCPQYLALTHQALREHGALAKIGPLLRTTDDQDALWGGLADGTLQTVGSDHVPKKHPDEPRTALLDEGFGAPSIETMLPLLFHEGVVGGRLTLERVVEVLCENPARLFGLYPRKGAIAVGADADVVLWDPEAHRTLGVGTEHSAAGYSLYEGRQVRGRPVRTIVEGRTVIDDGELVDAQRPARFLPTGPFDLDVGRAFTTPKNEGATT